MQTTITTHTQSDILIRIEKKEKELYLDVQKAEVELADIKENHCSESIIRLAEDAVRYKTANWVSVYRLLKQLQGIYDEREEIHEST